MKKAFKERDKRDDLGEGTFFAIKMVPKHTTVDEVQQPRYYVPELSILVSTIPFLFKPTAVRHALRRLREHIREGNLDMFRTKEIDIVLEQYSFISSETLGTWPVTLEEDDEDGISDQLLGESAA